MPRHPQWTWIRKRVSGLLLAALVAVMIGPAYSAESAEREDPLAGLDRDQRRVFANYTRVFCRQFFRYGENRFVLLPNHMRARENSSGRSVDQAEEEMTEIRKERRGLGVVEVRYPPPFGEVVASAKLLPEMDVGHYGYVSSVRIRKIVGPQEMIVSDIVLIPESEVNDGSKNTLRRAAYTRQQQYVGKTYRLLGFETETLKAGTRWQGPEKKGIHLAVMSTDPTSSHQFVLVNFSKLNRVNTREFIDALKYVHIEPLVFLDMVRDNKERLGAKGDTASLIAIYRRYYHRYRPIRVAQGPTTQPGGTGTQRDPEPETTAEDEQDNRRPKYTLDPPSDDGDDPPNTLDPEPSDDGDEQDDPATEDNEPEPSQDNDPPSDDDDDEDDWDYDEKRDNSPKDPTFFGIPLDG